MTTRTMRAAALLLQAAAAITTQTTTTTTNDPAPAPGGRRRRNGLVRYFAFGSNLAKSKMGSRGRTRRRWPTSGAGRPSPTTSD